MDLEGRITILIEYMKTEHHIRHITRKTLQLVAITLCLFLVAQSASAAKFAGDAFALGVGARTLALGGAVVAGPFDGTAAYWNPAGMTRLNGRSVTAMHAETFGSLLNHDYISYIDARPSNRTTVTAYGFYLYYLGGGGIKITDLNEFNRPYVVREESHGDYLLAASIAGSISSKIDFGLTAKLIYRDIGTESGKGLTLDLGLLYRAHNNVDIGLMVTDATTGFIRFSGDTFDTEGNTESIYPTVKPGFLVRYDYDEFTGRFVASGDIKFESLKQSAQYSSGALSLDSHLGFELSYREIAFGRVGSDIGRFTVGGGVHVNRFIIDLAYLHHGDFDATYRVSGSYVF